MFDDHPPRALDEQGTPSEFGQDPTLQVPRGDPVAVAVVADDGVEVDPPRFLMEQEHLQFRPALSAWRRPVALTRRVPAQGLRVEAVVGLRRCMPAPRNSASPAAAPSVGRILSRGVR